MKDTKVKCQPSRSSTSSTYSPISHNVRCASHSRSTSYFLLATCVFVNVHKVLQHTLLLKLSLSDTVIHPKPETVIHLKPEIHPKPQTVIHPKPQIVIHRKPEIHPKSATVIHPKPHSYPSKATDSYPSKATDSYPSKATDSYPSKATDSYPSQARDSFPSYDLKFSIL